MSISTVMAALRRRHGVKAIRRTFRHVATLPATPERVFPLLCPVREEEWIEGWRAEVVWSASGVVEPGAVFRTHVGMGEVWITARHDPVALRVEYAIFGGGHATLKLDLALEPAGEGGARLEIGRAYTGIDWAGRRRVRALTPAWIERDDRRIVRQLEHYLRTGEMLRGAGHLSGGAP